MIVTFTIRQTFNNDMLVLHVMKIAYQDAKRMHGATLVLLNKVIAIVEEYSNAGYRMTLRQLYYQLVARDIVPNKLAEYAKLSRILTDARMCGLIDWDFIEDRVRVRKMHSEFDDIPDLIETAIYSYRRKRWDNQEYYVEVIVEKNALIGVLEPITNKYHISIFPNVGYGSTTVIHELALRFKEQEENGKKCILLYFGDHDPSGEDMVRDITDRLDTFQATVEVIKVALTMEQINKYNPPPNPAKMTDPRAQGYVAEHGNSSWELDALPPNVLVDLLKTAIEEYIDMEKYDAMIEKENEEKELIRELAEREFSEGGETNE